MKYFKIIFVIAFFGTAALLIHARHAPHTPRKHSVNHSVPLSSLVDKMNYCEPKQPEGRLTKVQQQRIIDDAKHMSSYKGSQDDEAYKELQATYDADIAAYDTCSVKPL